MSETYKTHLPIKSLKPSKRSRYQQGYINPLSCKKLFESQRSTPIIYRSSYEKLFIQWLERSSKVLRWGSECVRINYVNANDGKQHSYYPDYLVETTDGVYLIEVKPYNQTVKPSADTPKDSYAWTTYITNVSKWKYAQTYCDNNGLKFKILTEKTIHKL